MSIVGVEKREVFLPQYFFEFFIFLLNEILEDLLQYKLVKVSIKIKTI